MVISSDTPTMVSHFTTLKMWTARTVFLATQMHHLTPQELRTKFQSTVKISTKRQTVTCTIEFYWRVSAKGPCEGLQLEWRKWHRLTTTANLYMGINIINFIGLFFGIFTVCSYLYIIHTVHLVTIFIITNKCTRYNTYITYIKDRAQSTLP
jgi:hypothetical protein